MPRIPNKTIFVEKDGVVYYIANWKPRFSTGVKAMLVKLSPRHLARYQALKARGRSQKSICYALFRKPRRAPQRLPLAGAALSRPAQPRPTVPPRATAVDAQPSDRVVVDIAILTADQLGDLICAALGTRIGLKAMPLPDLRKLYLAVLRQRVPERTP